MFWTEDFIEKYLKRSKEIRIDGTKLYDLEFMRIIVIAAFFHDMYMMVREYIPDDHLLNQRGSDEGDLFNRICKTGMLGASPNIKVSG